MDAASEVVTVPASDTTVTTAQTPTDTFNVNQSNNNTHTQANTHTHTASNSLLSKIASNVISNNSGSSLNIGGSSNSNSSCSSSSTSSNSSGYGSATTTPTNNYDLQNTTPTTTPKPTTTAANTEHIIPVATVAAVTPFFNEAITTHNLDTQHHLHHAQVQQSHEQLQEQQHHVLQAHHQQYSQNHLQSNLQHQQHHQYISRQQYYSPYDYQQSAPTSNLSMPSVTPTVAPYNMIIPGPYEMPSSNVAPAFGTSQYKASTAAVGSSYERSPLLRTNVAACTQQSQQQHGEQQQSKAINHHLLGSTKPRSSSSSFISSSTSTNTSKPQATATPFYANPIPFYDNYKHKLPLEYPDTYSNSSPAAAATYHQQQKYYAAAKSQLKEASYGSPSGLNTKSAYANTSSVFPGSTGGLNLSSASYDKYMYPHAPTTGYAATGHMGNETPPEVSNYRKPIVGSNLNSPSWHWGIEYASGNSRSIPPPASHIPTATVAPTHTTHLTQNPSVLARDPFYMTHDKYVGKYDKYSTSSYPQTYVSPPTNRHMWSNTPHASNLTQFNERHLLASGPLALPTHGPHTGSYFSNNHNASLSSRQACCSQPYQSQNCYYPVAHPVQPRLSHNQNSTVAPPPPAACLPGQQTLGQSPHLNALTASCKYGGVFPDYGSANKLKTSNDLYLNSHHYDINPPPHNFGYPTAHNSQQLYNTNAHQTMPHGATPTNLLTNDPFNASPTSYTNDLNLTTSNYDSYHTHLDNHPSQQTLTGIHNTQPPPAYGPTVAKRALLDYRKPIQPQPPPTISGDCYPSLTSRDHYNQHELLNTPETTTTFEEYEVHQSNATGQSAEVLSDTIEVAAQSTKNLSLRDFIANWNDDEDEYQNTEEINFDQTAVINEVLQTAPIEQERAAEVVSIQDVKVIKPTTHSVNDVETPKEAVKIAEDASVLLNEAKTTQYVNLPDIVIDVKKSNNVNNSITTPTTSPTLSSAQVETIGSALNLTDFDVEKELDELNLKKPLQQEPTKEIHDIKDPASVNTFQLSSTKNINNQLSFEDLNLEPTTKTVLNAISTRLTANQGPELNEQYLKDIEGYESSCSRHSNESAFEKEYETFINKITSESSCPIKKGDQKRIETDRDIDFDKNVQDFSKFYKRKRKLKDDDLKTSSTANQTKKKIRAVEATKTNNSNFPQVYTKKCRNRLPKVKHSRTYKCKPQSTFYKIVYFIRHQGLQRKQRVREFMLDLKDKHLPLIKRQSIKNYTPDVNESVLVPQTLVALCIKVFNTEEFRQTLKDQQQDNCLETEEKHICTDPTCETCEVIKSLMETENVEATLLQQTTETTTAYCADSTKEAMTILDNLPTTNDLNFPNEETIITSNTIADNQYVPENLSELVTSPVLSEHHVLEEEVDNFHMKVCQKTHAKEQPEAVLPTVFDNFETNFSVANKVATGPEYIASQTEDPSEFLQQQLPINTKTSSITEEIAENIIQPVGETSFYENFESKNFPDKYPLYCDLSASDLLDTTVAEAASADNSTNQVEKLCVPEESAQKYHLNERLSTETKPSRPLKDDERGCKSEDYEESDTEDSNSSDSESESSSSDTDNKSEDSCKKGSSNTESSDTDTEHDLEQPETCNLSSKYTQKEIRNQVENEATQKEELKVSGNMAEQTNFSAQNQTDINTKIMFENEKVPSSPQRIVIRITKSFSPNEQSLRVENISAKPLKTQNEYDDHSESDREDDGDIKKKKTDFLSTKQDDFVSIKPFENQTDDSDHAKDCSAEKKLVTPLKLVLRGKEYLRVKSIKKSPKLRTEHNDEMESESENEQVSKKKPKLTKTQEREDRKVAKKSKLKGKELLESNCDKEIPPLGLEQPCKVIDENPEFEADLEKERFAVSEIYESIDEKEQQNEEVADITLITNSDSKSESMAEDNATPISFSEEFDRILEKQERNCSFDESPENEAFLLAALALNKPLQNSKVQSTEVILEEHNQRNSNSSPKANDFNEDLSQLDFMQHIEVEEASSFAVLSENQDDVITENWKKTCPLEVIETYSLTDSEAETEVQSCSDSESCNSSDYGSYDEEPANCSISRPIVVSADGSSKVFKDQEMKTEPKNLELSNNPEFEKSERSHSSGEMHDVNVSNVVDGEKYEIDRSEEDFSDCSYTSGEDSDEKTGLNTRKSQKEEEKSLLDSSPINSTDSLENIVPKDSDLEQAKIEVCRQPVAYSNSEEVKSRTPLLIKEDYRICAPEACIPMPEEKSYTPLVVFKKIEQSPAPDNFDINASEKPAKDTYNSQDTFELPESENLNTVINQSVADNLKDAEKSLIQVDRESCSSRAGSPTSEEGSCTTQHVFEAPAAQRETTCSDNNLSTKTKAAYKAYDLQNVIREEDLSDSETGKSCSNSQKFKFNFNETAKDYTTGEQIDVEAHKSPLTAPVCAEYETKHLLEETVTFKSKSDGTAVLGEESEKLTIPDDIKSIIPDESPATKVSNKMEQIKTLEDNIDETQMEFTGVASEETKLKSLAPENVIPVCSKAILIDKFEDCVLMPETPKVPENEQGTGVGKNNVAAKTSSPVQEINEAILAFTKDSDIEEDSKTRSNALDQDNIETSKISLEIKDQSVITEIESRKPQICSEREHFNDCESWESFKTASLSLTNKTEVIQIKHPAQTETIEGPNKKHIQESLNVVRENISKSAAKEIIPVFLQNTNKEIIHSRGNTTEEGNFETEEGEDVLDELRGTLLMSEDISEGKTSTVEAEEIKAHNVEKTPLSRYEKTDEVESGDIKFNFKRMEEYEENILKESLTSGHKSDHTSKDGKLMANDNHDEEDEEREPIPEPGTETAASSLRQSSATIIKIDNDGANLTKEINTEEGYKKSSEKENNLEESSIPTNDLDFMSQRNHSKPEIYQEHISEGSNLGKSLTPTDSSCITYEFKELSKGSDDGVESTKDLKIEERKLSETTNPSKLTEQLDIERSCILPDEKQSAFEARNISKNVAGEDSNGEKVGKYEVTTATKKPLIKTKDHDLETKLIPNKSLDFISKIDTPLKDFEEITNGTIDEEEKVLTEVSNIKLKSGKESDLSESLSQVTPAQKLEMLLHQEESCAVSPKQDCEISHEVVKGETEPINEDQQNLYLTNSDQNSSFTEKDAEIADKNEKPESSEETVKNHLHTLSQNGKEIEQATKESTLELQKENSNGTASVKTISQPCTTPDELSADFIGFKNQSSFEDESEDFYGFEDREEVARIRQEIENLNDDSAANDGFLNNLTLNRVVNKTSITALTDSTISEISEMEALEKELSQHQLQMEIADDDKETEKEFQIKTIKVVSTNDIEHIKQMLESDEEPQNEGENKLAMMAQTSNDKSVENKNINVSKNRLNSVSSIIPKLSDLCRAALNSSLSSSSNLAQEQNQTATAAVESEVSVEEALAEMFRQAGVLLSDSEDCDNDTPTPDDTEAHDVLLINLQEILNSDNDVYVLQCDMNENVLNVVPPAEQHEELSLATDGVNAERVNTVQIIVDTQNSESQIHIISSDSESEVILLSDDDSEIVYKPLKAREQNVTIPFINDIEMNSGDDSSFDISTIHHEEIVPDNLTKFLRDEFYKYLHEKYVQRSISKYYHAQRVLKKYKRRFMRRE